MAVVRVKRHCDDEPIDALLLACKRRKTEDDTLTSVFKFAATVTDQEKNVSDVPKNVSNIIKTLGKSTFKTHQITNITDKLRADNKLFSQNNRFKVVNCFRSLDDSVCVDEGFEASGSNRGLTIVDVESVPVDKPETSKSSTASEIETKDAPQKYVYDIYYAADCNFDDKLLENPISFHALDDLVCEDYPNNVFDAEEESDDSNDENNWRNDYPDEDPDSIGEEDMKLACRMGGLDISETNSLSSDGGEEDLVYGMDDPDYVQDCSSKDEDYFGHDYAAYKKRVTMLSGSDASENSDFFYCDSDRESDIS